MWNAISLVQDEQKEVDINSRNIGLSWVKEQRLTWRRWGGFCRNSSRHLRMTNLDKDFTFCLYKTFCLTSLLTIDCRNCKYKFYELTHGSKWKCKYKFYELTHGSKWKCKYKIYEFTHGRVFTNGPGDMGSIPGRVIPKTLKMVLDTSLLNTRQYKACIESKAEQSR